MKIIILTDQLHTHGGIEKLVTQKSNYWTDVFDFDVKIITTNQEQKPFTYKLSKKVGFVDLAIKYNLKQSFFTFFNILRIIQNFYKIQRLVFQEKPDFILVASHIPITYLLPFIKTKAKIIKEFHFSKYNQKNSFKERIFNFIERKYFRLILLSEEESGFYNLKNKMVIPNPVIIPKIKIKNISQRSNTAIAILRYAPVKNLESMISVWEKFQIQNPNWQLLIYGTKKGNYFEKIQKLVKEKNLESSIQFKGKTNNVSLELNNAKLLLMTSHQECFPMVILEANACGVPVISFDCPTGPRNIINNNIDGVLVENKNEKRMVNVLNYLAQNQSEIQRLSNGAIKNAKKFELEKVMNIWKSKIFNNR